MAVGDVKGHDYYGSIRVLEGQTTDKAAPSSDTDGIDLSELAGKVNGLFPASVSLVLKVTGSGTLSINYVRYYAYSDPAAEWIPPGPGTASGKAKLNEGRTLEETSTDKILHMEEIYLPSHASRFDLEINGLSGTSPSVDAWLVFHAVRSN